MIMVLDYGDMKLFFDVKYLARYCILVNHDFIYLAWLPNTEFIYDNNIAGFGSDGSVDMTFIK